MPHLRNLTLLTLLVLSGVLPGLNFLGAKSSRAASASAASANSFTRSAGGAGHRTPYTPNSQAITVTNADNDGSGSLRFAISAANMFSGDDTIVFDPAFFNTPRTITLTSGELSITDSVTITGPGANLLTLSGNKASRIFNVAASAVTVTISGLTISNGVTGQFEGGGGIFSQSNLTLTACSIVNNVSVGSGSPGGGVAMGGGVGTFVGCTFSGNTSPLRGGAVALNNASGAFTNCTISGNTADFGGGLALFNTAGERTLAVTNCTVVNNSSSGTGGIRVEVAAGLTTNATLRNTIIANNTAPNLTGLLGGATNAATIQSSGNNLTSDNSNTFLNQATDQINKDPLIGPLQNNGGRTATHLLLAGSPALDKGGFVTGLTADQRGATTPFDIASIPPASTGDNSDIGAVEMQAIFVANANDSGAGSLRQAVTSANSSPNLSDILFDNTFFNTARTITLAGELALSTSQTISGPGADLLTLSGNNANRIFRVAGGGLNVAISGLTISNGKGVDVGGGIVADSNLTLTGCAIINNAAASGGGVYVGGAVGTFTGCTFNGNTADNRGGAIYLRDSSGTLTNCTISGNMASGAGGGGAINLFNTNGNRSLAVTNSTVVNNTGVGTGTGGIRVEVATGLTSSATIRNTIIANSTGPNLAGLLGGAANAARIVSQGFNLTNDNTSIFLNQATDIINANPQLSPLRNNGGSTPTHALLSNSPALDKGSSPEFTTDQRGLPRRFDLPGISAATGGDNSDIGAYETQGQLVANTNDSGTGSLRQAIADATANSEILFDLTVFNALRTITLSSGEISINKNLTITGPGANLLTLSGNNANRIFSVAGGGLNVAISGLTVSNGRAPDGGGINSASNLTLSQCAIVNNTASAGAGAGGGVNVSGAVGTFTECTFSGNTAGLRGGGVHLSDSGGTLTNCTVSGNTAPFAGGIAFFNTNSNRTLAVTNCTIANNTSQNNGSGLLVEVAAGLTSTATARNSIIANNPGPSNIKGLLGGADSPTTLKSQGFNLTSDNSTTFLNQATDQVNKNPLLGPLQSNGGPTQTHALLPNSPALDKGNSAGIATDQRGRTRPFDISGLAPATGGDNSDIGAVEMQASIVRNDEVVAMPGSLRQVIEDAPAGADILFDPAFFNVPRRIFVSGGEVLINKNLTINGPGANLLTISGANLNRVFRVAGGGLNVSISGVTISGGKATGVGGGIASDSNLALTACNVINNTATDGGGGVYVGGAVGTFADCTFTGNTSGTGGGAVRLINATATFSACTFSGNTSANYFGAVSFTNSSGTMTNCTVSGNTTTGTGFGSIGLFANSGVRTLAITGCTIANNISTGNGGVYIESSGTGTNVAATIRNTIVANNGVNTGGTIATGALGAITSLGYNLTNDPTNVSLNHATDIVNANPQLGPLQNNGGLTQTRALLFGSPAIDKGSSSGVATDQRGVRRPVDDPLLTNAAGGDGADIGAFERTAPAVVSAASYKGSPFAQESIVAAFGENLTAGTAVATTVPLPITLDNTSVSVTDSGNTARMAPLFFVSPGQFNFQIPPGTAIGAATISVVRNGNVVASTSVNIAAVEPSLFTANASGTGAPAAILYRGRNGVLTTESVTAPIDLGPAGDVVVLVLYGTGIRKRTSLSNVAIKIGGVNVTANFADAAPGFVGLDQINTAPLPRSLAGKGTVNLELTVDGKPANVVTLNFK